MCHISLSDSDYIHATNASHIQYSAAVTFQNSPQSRKPSNILRESCLEEFPPSVIILCSCAVYIYIYIPYHGSSMMFQGCVGCTARCRLFVGAQIGCVISETREFILPKTAVLAFMVHVHPTSNPSAISNLYTCRLTFPCDRPLIVALALPGIASAATDIGFLSCRTGTVLQGSVHGSY